MVGEEQKKIPFCFCTECRQLAPITLLAETRTCLVCNTMVGPKDGGKLIYFDKHEAELRGLTYVDRDL